MHTRLTLNCWYIGGAWVGLRDSQGLVQSGVGWSVTVDSSGHYSYSFGLWYEWFPGPPTTVDMAVAPGNVIDIWCEITTSSTAFCIINNISTGVENTYQLSAPSSAPTITPLEVDWIVEVQGTLANFGAVTFTNCFAVAGTSKLEEKSFSILDCFMTFPKKISPLS